MKKFFGAMVIGLVAFFVSIGLACANGGGMTFVADDDELNAALESAEQGTIGSVAIAERFYFGSAKRTKDRIRGLIARTFELGDRSVFVYDKSLDSELATQLLGRPMVNCRYPYYLAVHVDGAGLGGARTSSCGISNLPLTEERMRSMLGRLETKQRE